MKRAPAAGVSIKKEVYEGLYEAALEALNNAYSPYSKIKVGAALIDERGLIFSGCNVENASYGTTICAERVAITKAISEGAKEAKAYLVLTEAKTPWSPCGLCRQVMLEFSQMNTPVILANTKRRKRNLTLKKLCPEAFSKFQIL